MTVNHIKEIQATLEKNDAGFRKQSGTVLKNLATGEIKLIPPLLYLSRYIIKNKSDYYKLLNDVSFNNGLNNWILFMLKGIEEISKETIPVIKTIEEIMRETKSIILEQKPKIYSKDLIEALFYHPYTKRVFIEEQLSVSRPTATVTSKSLKIWGF